jgi:transcriptional regulator with XRE-family HTH domain
MVILCFVNTWELEQARRVGAEVQRLRKESKRSAQWLSEKTEQLGLKITRQAITDLENGRRRYVTTAELVILAIALNAAPVTLVYPGPYTNRVELAPGVEAPEILAAEWFSGNKDWRLKKDGETEVELAESELFEKNTHRLYLEREFFEALTTLNRLRDRGAFEEDRELIEYYDKRVRDLRAELGGDAE